MSYSNDIPIENVEDSLDKRVFTAEDFEIVGVDPEGMEVIARPSVGYFKDFFNRLLKNKIAVLSMIVLLAIVLLSIFVPMFSPYTIDEQHNMHSYEGMMYVDETDGHMHIFGTDNLGRDIFVRLWAGGRTSLFIAVSVVLINVCIGVVYGGVSGFVGGAVDNIMMRVVEILSGIPYMMIVILLLVVKGKGLSTIILAFVIVGWTGIARLVRGQVIQLKEQEFIVAAKALGASPARIIMRHLVPNILSIIIVQITLAIPSAIFTEAFLSYLGLGISPPKSSWGLLAQDGAENVRTSISRLLVPSITISLTMLSFNLLGDAMRDASDPKLRR